MPVLPIPLATAAPAHDRPGHFPSPTPAISTQALPSREAEALLSARPLGPARLRLLPKLSGMRPIVNLGRATVVRFRGSRGGGGGGAQGQGQEVAGTEADGEGGEAARAARMDVAGEAAGAGAAGEAREAAEAGGEREGRVEGGGAEGLRKRLRGGGGPGEGSGRAAATTLSFRPVNHVLHNAHQVGVSMGILVWLCVCVVHARQPPHAPGWCQARASQRAPGV